MSRFALVLLVPLTCLAQQPHEQEVQRAIIELNERSAAFARGEPPRPLAPHVGQPLHADPEIARQLRPYERMRMAEQADGPFVLQLPPPALQERKSGSDPDLKPLPLPRRSESVVDPVDLPRPRD
jgi:hypothetical protein